MIIVKHRKIFSDDGKNITEKFRTLDEYLRSDVGKLHKRNPELIKWRVLSRELYKT